MHEFTTSAKRDPAATIQAMEVVGAAASFIAIGQALAGIPKLISIIQTIADTREELEDLLFEV